MKIRNVARVVSRISSGLIVFSISAAMLVATGCTQDPYAEKSEQIRNGIPPELDTAPPAAKPVSSEALRIDTLDFYSFKELVEGEIILKGRVLEPNPNFELSVDNLKEFPGASFDPKTSSFKWTPPRETTGNEYGAPKRLVVRLTSISAALGTTLGTTKSVLLYVTRVESDPTIVQVDDLVKTSTREGERRAFNVTVVDPDSFDADGGRPRLVSVPAKRGPLDVSGLVYMQEDTIEKNPVQDAADKHKWVFKMYLDLRVPPNQRGRNFTDRQDTFKFGLQAVSRFGHVGMKDVDAQIVTDVLKPETSWLEPIEAVAGQENVIQFTVFDPYSEGKLSVNFTTRVDQLPGAAIANCKSGSRDGNILCRISWKPLSTTLGDFSIEFEALNQSQAPRDTKFVKEPFRRVIRVVAGPPPPTPPPSTPPVQPAPVP